MPDVATSHSLLFDAIFVNDSAIDPLVREWMESYQMDQIDAMVELVNFLIQSTGCPGFIERRVFDEEQDIVECLELMQGQFDLVRYH